MSLGKKISQYRKALGVSQEELGGRLGVSRQAVSKWETGAATPDMANLIALAREFGISVAELTETPPEPGPLPEPDTPPETSAPRRRAWLWYVPLALLFAVMIAGLAWLYRDRQAGQVEDIPVPVRGEFALIWTNHIEHEEFLELGVQDRRFPFGTTLELTAPEEVLDTDFGGMTLHRADCGAVLIEYRHIEADPELGPKATDQDVIDALSTIVPGHTTPRDIGPGSTEADLLAAYGDDLVYCLKEAGGYTLVPHDHYYAWTSFSDGYSVILFYMERSQVTGIRMETLGELGDWYAPDNISRFPMENGNPDFSHRQEPELEDLSDTRRVYIALNQLETNNNLTAEERYACRRDIFTLLPDLDWTELGQMGAAEYPADTIFALMDWLQRQDTYTESEIFRIQTGSTAKGIDGAYAEAYDGLLSHVFFYDPVTFIGNLAQSGDPEEPWKFHSVLGAAFDGVWYPQELAAARETLNAALSSGAFTQEASGWCRLMLLYLEAAEQDNFGDLPHSPSELP